MPSEPGPRATRTKASREHAKLEAALGSLSECVTRIQALIQEMQASLDPPGGEAVRGHGRRMHIVHGGGPSAFAPRERKAGDARAPAETNVASTRVLPPAPDVVIATELSLAGYSRQEIEAHLRTLRGPGADVAIADAAD